MALMAALEADLRALSAEARRRYPAVKDGAEHAILKLRSLSDPNEIAFSDDILRIFLLACEVKSTKLSVIGLSCLQKLIAHDAVASSALKEILKTLKDHAEMNDESVQLKTLQTILIIFQSRLHPENEENMVVALGICLRLLENSRCADSVHNTAAATFRQAVALIFDRIISDESLPSNRAGSGRQASRSLSVSEDVTRSIATTLTLSSETNLGVPLSSSKEPLSEAGKLGLRLFEDLVVLSAGGSVTWLHVTSLQRIFALDILEFLLSNYISLFRALLPYQQVLRHQVCSLLMTSLRATGEIEGEAGEPVFRRLVLRCVSHLIRLYSSALVTECEVFLSMLIKITNLDLLLWHRIMVLEVLRSFCVEARVLRLFFQTYDMQSGNTNIVAGMTKALAQVVISLQVQDTNEESLAAVAGMFSSKAKGIEWSMDNDSTNAAVVVASEAHAITLAIEGLLGIVFTLATLTDEAIECGELRSPRGDNNQLLMKPGEHASICVAMVTAVWKTILDALSLILSRSQGEAIVLEILKGYQAFTQACGVLHAIEPLNAFLESLCKFTLPSQSETDKRSSTLGTLSSPGGKRSEYASDPRDSVVLTPKNVQALRTLFNIAHRLDNVLGPSWILVLENLAALDRIIHSPHATTQEVSTAVPRLTRESFSLSSDFNILSSLNTQLFESSGSMSTSAVTALVGALRQLSYDSLFGVSSGVHQSAASNFGAVGSMLSNQGQQTSNKMFAIERMIAVLTNNLYRVELLWNQVITHFLELAEHGSQPVRNVALDALDRSISTVLASEKFRKKDSISPTETFGDEESSEQQEIHDTRDNGSLLFPDPGNFEDAVISPIRTLYYNNQNVEVRAGSLKILLHVLERHGEKLYQTWPSILDLLRAVVNSSEKELIPLGFQSVRVIMNDGLVAVPTHCLEICVKVVGSYSAQNVDVNISLTAIGLLWTTSDFFGRSVNFEEADEKETGQIHIVTTGTNSPNLKGKNVNNIKGQSLLEVSSEKPQVLAPGIHRIYSEELLVSVFDVLQDLGTDDRPEVRNSAIRTLFQSLSSLGNKLSYEMWAHCLWKVVFPLFSNVQNLAANSSKDEWQGKELGMKGGKPVHMLVHHSRNTAQKQWDETLVLVLGGISRLLRSLFPIFQTMDKFSQGWECLLHFVEDSILNGSKEVAIAANNCLLSVLLAHCLKGTMPMSFFESGFAVYEVALQNASHYESRVSTKVKQELLRSLGEMYQQGFAMFKIPLYLRVLELVDLIARNPKNVFDDPFLDSGYLSPIQRTVLEIFVMLKPKNESLLELWPTLLRKVLCYLPGSDTNASKASTEDESYELKGKDSGISEKLKPNVTCGDLDANILNGSVTSKNSDSSISTVESSHVTRRSSNSNVKENGLDNFSCPLFAEKAIAVLTELFLDAPIERLDASAEVIAALGRCMLTRRDSPNGSLWRVAVKAFNSIMLDDMKSLQSNLNKPHSAVTAAGRSRFWKEVAEIYDSFLVGSCGRAFLAESLSLERCKEDESLEVDVLDVLCNNVLKSSLDAPAEVVQRLVTALDTCAARTSSLPIESVGLLPPHCSRFSLNCLKKLFALCRYEEDRQWEASELISQIALPTLLNRCTFILNKFLADENDSGETPLPSIRVEEIVYVLQELARLVIHSSMASILDLPDCFKANFQDSNRSHLFVLFPPLCELVISREARVCELVQVLLRLITGELGLNKRFF